jgi:hypothetical protein
LRLDDRNFRHPSARDREPARPGTHLQATAGLNEILVLPKSCQSLAIGPLQLRQGCHPANVGLNASEAIIVADQASADVVTINMAMAGGSKVAIKTLRVLLAAGALGFAGTSALANEPVNNPDKLVQLLTQAGVKNPTGYTVLSSSSGKALIEAGLRHRHFMWDGNNLQEISESQAK